MAEKMTERDKGYYYDKGFDDGFNKAVDEAAELAKKPNKMLIVAAQFGKRLNERFTVNRNGYIFSVRFTEYGLDIMGEWDNPYFDVNANVLQDLLIGEAVIIDD